MAAIFKRSRERMQSRAFQGALSVVIVLGLLWGWHKWREPRFHGRGVRSWIEQLPYDNSSDSESNQAMDSFGDAAAPYLIDAMIRPEKWERGWLAKIPRAWLSYVISLPEQQQVSRTALWRLNLLARAEIERNELEIAPRFPVLDQLRPVLDNMIHSGTKRHALELFQDWGPITTNFSGVVTDILQTSKPGEWEWIAAAQQLGRERDAKLTTLFLNQFATNTTANAQRCLIYALGRNAVSNSQVADVIRQALARTNETVSPLPGSGNDGVQAAALLASASLGISCEKALEVIQQMRTSDKQLLQAAEIAEPFLRWRMAPDDPAIIKQVQDRLAKGTKPLLRLKTADLLQTIGPAAKPFIPALSEMALERETFLQVRALRAMRAIAPEEASRLIPKIPKTPTR